MSARTKKVEEPQVETPVKTELSKVEKFYVDEHLDVDADVLAEELGVDVSLVEAYLDEFEAQRPSDFERALAKKAVDPQNPRSSNALIMTEAASQRIDENYKNTPKQVPSYVFNPKSARKRRS